MAGRKDGRESGRTGDDGRNARTPKERQAGYLSAHLWTVLERVGRESYGEAGPDSDQLECTHPRSAQSGNHQTISCNGGIPFLAVDVDREPLQMWRGSLIFGKK